LGAYENSNDNKKITATTKKEKAILHAEPPLQCKQLLQDSNKNSSCYGTIKQRKKSMARRIANC